MSTNDPWTKCLSQIGDSKTFLKDVEPDLTRLVESLFCENDAEPPIEKCKELCGVLIGLLRKKTTQEEAKRVGRVWEMLHRVCKEMGGVMSEMEKEAVYGLIRGVKDGLACLMDCPSAMKALLKGASFALKTLGMEHSATLFRLGFGFRDGLQILTSCLAPPASSKRISLGAQVAQVMTRVVRQKPNSTGALDLMRRQFLNTFVEVYPSLVEKTPWEELVIGILFHSSMMKPWMIYLGCNDAVILLGKEAGSAKAKAPSIHAFVESIQASVTSFPCTSVLFPCLMRSFVKERARMKIHPKMQVLSEKRAGFLFAARLIDLCLKVRTEQEMVQSVVSDLLVEMERCQLYQPTLDEGFLQLQFLQRMVRRVLVHPIMEDVTSPRKKKRKLHHSTTAPGDEVKLQICSVVLRMEHRSFTPFLAETLKLLGESHEILKAGELLVQFMEAWSRSRKWTSLVSVILRALPRTPTLSKLLDLEAVLDAFRRGIENLPTLEIQEFLEMFLQEIQQQSLDLWSLDVSEISESVTGLVEVIVGSVQIHETNAVSVGQSLSQLMPSYEQLQRSTTSPSLSRFLQISDIIDRRLEICKAWNPLIAEARGLRCMEIESLLPVEDFLGRDELGKLMQNCLLRRMAWLADQKVSDSFTGKPVSAIAHGERVVTVLLEVMKRLKADSAMKLRDELLMKLFIPFISLCPSSTLSAFLEGILDDISPPLALLEKLFQNPVVHSDLAFRESWKTAFFKSVRRRTTAHFPSLQGLSIAEMAKAIKKLLTEKLHQPVPEHAAEGTHVVETLDLLEFGLKLPVFVFGTDRLRLEFYVILISTLSSHYRILKCLALFSLESLQGSTTELAGYVRMMFVWVHHFCRQRFLESAKESLARAEAAMFAILKQLLFSQWSDGAQDIFRTSSKKPQRKKQRKNEPFTADWLLALLREGNEESAAEQCFQLSGVAVFVRLCNWFCTRRPKPRLTCLKASIPPLWAERMDRQLKRLDASPDYDQISLFLQARLIPYLQEKAAMPEEAPWSHMWLGMMSGIVADLSGISHQDTPLNLHGFVLTLLPRIECLAASGRWTEAPVCLERVAYFLQTLCVSMDGDTVGEAVVMNMAHLLLSLLVKVTEACHPRPHHLKQSFMLAASSAEIVYEDDKNGALCINALRQAFSALLSHGHHSKVYEKLIGSLEQSATLASKFGCLQLLMVFVHHEKSQPQSAQSRLLGKLLERLYPCFWEGYFRHVLLTLVQRKKKKRVPMPTPEESGVFSALLCSFFRVMSFCHNFSSSLPQRITILIMRRIIRIIQALYRRTRHGDLSSAAPWFGEMCGFLISAIRQQKSPKAARALFPSFRATLETLFALLLAWKIETADVQSCILDKAEIQLGSVYSETAACPAFADGLPDLLFSYMKTVDTLRTRDFTKKCPLAACFKKETAKMAISKMKPAERVHRRVMTVYASLRSPQIKHLESQLGTNEHFMAQMKSFARETGLFTGHDG